MAVLKDPRWTSYPGLRSFGDEEAEALRRVLSRGALYRGAGLQGPEEVEACERELAALTGRRFAVLLNSGTSALSAALKAAGVQRGDEVVVAGFGWLTDVSAVVDLGAVPVIAPIGDDLTVDVAALEACLSERTRAVVPIHPCGLPCDLDGVRAIAAARGVAVVDDGCQALGARSGGVPLGGGTAASILSFQSFKIVTCGEGGGLVTDDEDVYLAAVRYHDAGLDRFAHLSTRRYDGPVGVGLNLRLTELQAALLRVQLRRLPGLLQRLGQVRARMKDALGDWLGRGFEVVEPRVGTSGNGTFLVLRAPDPGALQTFVQRMSMAGVPCQPALSDRYHAAVGWLRYLEDQGIPHRAVGGERSVAHLGRLAMIDVQPYATDEMIEGIARA